VLKDAANLFYSTPMSYTVDIHDVLAYNHVLQEQNLSKEKELQHNQKSQRFLYDLDKFIPKPSSPNGCFIGVGHWLADRRHAVY
jgi:hypothetical protein